MSNSFELSAPNNTSYRRSKCCSLVWTSRLFLDRSAEEAEEEAQLESAVPDGGHRKVHSTADLNDEMPHPDAESHHSNDHERCSHVAALR